MEHPVSFLSSGLKISGVLHVPEQASAQHKQAAVVVLHGFGSNKSGGISKAAAELFTAGLHHASL